MQPNWQQKFDNTSVNEQGGLNGQSVGNLSRFFHRLTTMLRNGLTFGDNLAGSITTVNLTHNTMLRISNPTKRTSAPDKCLVLGCDGGQSVSGTPVITDLSSTLPKLIGVTVNFLSGSGSSNVILFFLQE